MKKSISIILLFGIVLLFYPVSCKAVENYYPLKEGKSWTYQISMESKYGMIQGIEKMIVTNFEEREIEGKKVTPQKIDLMGNAGFVFIASDKTGVCTFAEQLSDSIEPEIKSTPSYSIKNPIKVGTTWSDQTETLLFDREISLTLNITIESVDETVTVPAGTFKNCLKISAKGKTKKDLGLGGEANVTVEEYNWYAPGIGLIKSIRMENSNNLLLGSGQLSLQLETFK